MTAPTNKALLRWWDEIAQMYPGAVFTCHHCGRKDSGAYVQPQHPFFARNVPGVTIEDGIAFVAGEVAALCGDGVAEANRRAAVARKVELAALPRCEVDGCKMRGSVRVARVALLCGRHYKRVRAEHNRTMAGAGGMGLFLPGPTYSRADVLGMARQ
jgi:hypothetical protein